MPSPAAQVNNFDWTPVEALLDERLAERGLTPDDVRAIGEGGANLHLHWEGFGPVLSLKYVYADGGEVRRLLLLDRPKHEGGGWRWPTGTKAKGAVMVLAQRDGDEDHPLDALKRAGTVVVCEGESDAFVAWRHLQHLDGFAVICVPGSTMVGDDLASFIGNGAHVVLAMDADTAGDTCAERVRSVLIASDVEERLISRVRPEVPGVDEPDLRDLIEHLEGTVEDVGEELHRLLLGAGSGDQQLDADGVDQDRGDDDLDGDLLEDDTLGALLVDVGAFVERFVRFARPPQLVAVVLWIAHAHAADAAEATPYLAVTSPEKRSGKTRLLEVLELLVPRPLRTANISTASLFRTIADTAPTVFVDEVDSLFGRKGAPEHEDMRALLNAGHRRGAEVVRMVGQSTAMKAVKFPVFGPKVLAGIGQLPDTIGDRSIVIRLQRQAPGERVARFRRRVVEREGSAIAARLARLLEPLIDDLREAWPDLPDALNDRAADGWEPLLAIADAASGEWPSSARSAALELEGHAAALQTDDSLGVRLLRDIHFVLEARGEDRITTADLLIGLVALEEAPWGDLGGKAITARRLGDMLRRYEIKSRTIWLRDGTSAKGYLSEQFEDAWNRYTPHDVGSETSCRQTLMSKGIRRDFNPTCAAAHVGLRTPVIPHQ